MLQKTRCFPVGGLTLIRCLIRNAQSPVPELGAVATAQLLTLLRPCVRGYAAPLVAGLKQPSLTLGLHVEHALVERAASLHTCRATTDGAFYLWVSKTTTSSVLENHAAYRALWTPQLHAAQAHDDDDDVSSTRNPLGRGRAA